MSGKKYVVITGASSGIGYETAKAFAARGKNVVIAARRRERLEKLRDEIIAGCPGVDVTIREVDLSDSADTVRFYDSLKDLDIEAFVNNAGLGNSGNILDPEMEHNLRMFHVNMDALALLSTLYVRDYCDAEGAQLINVASSAGYMMFPGATLYSATKFFAASLTEGIDQEMKVAGHKLRAPGATQTEFEQAAHESAEAVDYDAKFRHYSTATEMAGYLLELYDSNAVVAMPSFEGGLELTEAKHPNISNVSMPEE